MEEEASTAASAETLDPETVAGPADDPALAIEDVDVLDEAGPADPTDPATMTPPEVDEEDVEPESVPAAPRARPLGSVLWRDQRKGVVRS